MENRQGVEKIMTVFDLSDCGLSHPTGKAPTRVMLVYEKGEKQKHFTILDKNMPQHVQTIVALWLERNFDLKCICCDA
jgi:hypothetical protein